MGAVLRWSLTQAWPDGGGLAWTTFTTNVAGSFALALLPALDVVRRHQTLSVALGPGLLGGFTTLSAYSDQTRVLLGAGHQLLAGAYLLGTLVTCLLAVAAASRLSSLAEQRRFAGEEADE